MVSAWATILTLFALSTVFTVNAALESIRQVNDCSASYFDPHCELIFSLTDSQRVTISTSSWSRAEAITNLAGSCAVNASTNELVLTPSVNKKVVRCSFFFRDGTTFDPQTIVGTVSLPGFTYLEAPIEFIPSTSTCKDQRTQENCYGVLQASSKGFPFVIKTTSLMAATSSCTQMVITNTSSEPIGVNGARVYTYSVSAQAGALDEFLQCPVELQKSPLSPYFYFYRPSSAALLPYGQSRDIVFSTATVSVPALSSQSNCLDPTNSVCTLILEFDKDLLPTDATQAQLADFHFSFDNYFIPVPDRILAKCDAVKYADEQYNSDVNNIWCLTTLKPLEVATTRDNIVNNVVQIQVTSSTVEIVLNLDITNVAFTTPVWFEYDDYCNDPSTPFCGIMIKSRYQGPAMTLTFPTLPFDNRIEFLDCYATTQMHVTTTTITFPSALHKHENAGKVRLPTGQAFHLCVAYTAISYKKVYPESDDYKWALTSYTDEPTGIVRRNITPLSRQPIIGGNKVHFDKFPIQIEARSNCMSQFEPMCSIAFHTYLDPLNPMSWMRSFDVYIPGMDSDYVRKTSLMEKYQVTYENFRRVDHTVSVQLVPKDVNIPNFDHTGSLTDERYYFSIFLFSEYYAEGYWEDSSKPTTIVITYRKAPDALFRPASNEGVVPFFLTYAQSPLSSQPLNSELFLTPEAVAGGLGVFFRPNFLVYPRPSCDVEKFKCRLTLRRWTTDTTTYFLVSPTSIYRNVQIDLTHFNAVFMDQDLNEIPILTQPAPGIGPGYTFKVDTSLIPLTSSGVSPDGVSYYDYDCYYVRSSGTFVLTTISFFDFTFINNVPTLVRPPLKLEQPGAFETDVLPTFHEDCALSAIPFCTVTYTFNDHLPPNWTAMEHQLPADIIDDIVPGSFSCSHIAVDRTSGQVPYPTISLMPAGTASLFNTTPRDTPWIRVANSNSSPMMLANDDVPVTCTISFRLLSSRGRSRHLLDLWTIHQLNVEGVNLHHGVFIPAISWSPVLVTGGDNCRTATSTSTYQCDLTIRVWGSPTYLVQSLEGLFPKEASMFGYGLHKFYSRQLTIAEQNDPKNDALVLAYLDYGEYAANDPRVVDGKTVFYNFYTAPAYRNREFTCYYAWTGPALVNSSDPLDGIYPPSPLSLNFNGNDGQTNSNPDVFQGRKWNNPLYTVPAAISRSIISIKTIKNRYSGVNTQFFASTITFDLPVHTMMIETDFGLPLLPCIATSSIGIVSKLKDHLPLEEYLSLLKLPQEEQFAKLQEYRETIFIDPVYDIVPIMGYFERKEFSVSSDRALKTIYQMQFTMNAESRPDYANDKSGPTGLTCMWFMPINSKFPTLTNNIKHTIKLDMPPVQYSTHNKQFQNEDWYQYHSYPTFLTTANIGSV